MSNANFDVPIFKTIKETANLTGFSEYCLRKMVLKNKIKYVQSGKKYLININALIGFLNEGDVKEV